MHNIKDDFVPYSIAMKLKQLGFNEPCFAYYNKEKLIIGFKFINHEDNTNSNAILKYGSIWESYAPLYQQAFRWFREEHKINYWITNHYDKEFYSYLDEIRYPKTIPREDLRILKISDSYRDAEIECLNRLVELITKKNKTLNYDKKID